MPHSQMKGLSRRALLGTGAAAGLVGAAGLGRAQAAYPSRSFDVLIATGQGGGAETMSRAFTNLLRVDLGQEFEYEFHPGAGGQVGYELYANRRDKDGYNVMFSNFNPEIITFATQDTNYDIPGDITHFAKVFGSPIVIYVGADSPFTSIEQLVEEGKKRTITVATSRLPHPGSIGVLALGDATGADFNLVPFGGGNPTSMAAITGEVDCAVLTAGVAISLGDQVRVLASYRDVPALTAQMGNAPTVNKAFGIDLPELDLSSGWAVHTEVWENMPEFREVFEKAVINLFSDPRLQEQFAAVHYPLESIEYGGPEVCAKIVKDTIEFARRYADRLKDA